MHKPYKIAISIVLPLLVAWGCAHSEDETECVSLNEGEVVADACLPIDSWLSDDPMSVCVGGESQNTPCAGYDSNNEGYCWLTDDYGAITGGPTTENNTLTIAPTFGAYESLGQMINCKAGANGDISLTLYIPPGNNYKTSHSTIALKQGEENLPWCWYVPPITNRSFDTIFDPGNMDNENCKYPPNSLAGEKGYQTVAEDKVINTLNICYIGLDVDFHCHSNP